MSWVGVVATVVAFGAGTVAGAIAMAVFCVVRDDDAVRPG